MIHHTAASALDVTIVVHSGHQAASVERALRSILDSAADSTLTAEVIVLSERGSAEPQTDIIGTWPVQVRADHGEPIAARLNRAVAEAGGSFLCFISALSVVPAGWLSTLIHTFDVLPGVGAIGPLLLDEADRIHSTGAVLSNDGTLRRLGAGSSLKDRRGLHMNDVDALESDCLLMRTDSFRRVDGFTADYRTSGYRDADLCLRLAAQQLRVIVDPRVQVLRTGAPVDAPRLTPSRDEESDRERLALTWSGPLAARPDLSVPLDRARVSARKAVITCHYPRTPTWDQDSGALRIWTLLVELVRSRYHVVLVCPSELNPYLADLHAAGIETVQAWWGGDTDCVRMIQAYHPRAAIFTHAESESRFGKSYEVLSPETIRLSDTVDLHFLRERRRVAAANGLAGEPRITVDTLGADGLDELSSALRSDITVVVSQYERQLLIESLFLDPDRVRIVSNVHEPSPERPPFELREGFTFLGGYNHPPNVDSILWIVERVWPLIRSEIPEARLRIYGSAMPDRVKALHDPTNGIEAVGFVADHRAALRQARVMLSPLTYGAGVKGKIGESLAVGTPVVTNRIGAEGMDEGGRALAIAEDPSEVAQWAVRLHTDQDEWKRRAEAGIVVLAERFSAAANIDQLLTAIDEARPWRGQPSFWNLLREMLWHERGCPGEPLDLGRAIDFVARQSEQHAAVIDEYRRSINRLKESQAQLQLELAQSAAKRQELLRRRQAESSSHDGHQ